MRLLVLFALAILLTTAPLLAREPQAEMGAFLVASDAITDSRFAKTVILLIQHDTRGSLGLIINKPTNINLKHLFKVIPDSVQTDNIYFGGPVAPKQFMALLYSTTPPTDSTQLLNDTYLLGVKGAFDKLLHGTSREHIHFFFGYAGWAPGQLQKEIQRGDWKVRTGGSQDIFKTPADKLWQQKESTPDGRWVEIFNKTKEPHLES